jgi:hypothetical protein
MSPPPPDTLTGPFTTSARTWPATSWSETGPLVARIVNLPDAERSPMGAFCVSRFITACAGAWTSRNAIQVSPLGPSTPTRLPADVTAIRRMIPSASA